MKGLGPNGHKLCKNGHERSPENVSPAGQCKSCVIAANHIYQESNREKLKEQKKLYRIANKERDAERQKKYRMDNKEELAEKQKQYIIENRVKVSERRKLYRIAGKENRDAYSKQYKKDNPMIYRLSFLKRKAIKKAVGGQLSRGIADVLLIRQKGMCRICKIKLEGKKFHLDHIIPISKGGPNVDGNIQLLCSSCNCKKSAKLPHVYAQELGMLFL